MLSPAAVFLSFYGTDGAENWVGEEYFSRRKKSFVLAKTSKDFSLSLPSTKFSLKLKFPIVNIGQRAITILLLEKERWKHRTLSSSISESGLLLLSGAISIQYPTIHPKNLKGISGVLVEICMCFTANLVFVSLNCNLIYTAIVKFE